MLPRVITCCAVLLDVTKSYYMLPSVVACNLELLHDVQCCFYVTNSYYMLCCVVTCYQGALHDVVPCCYMF